MNVHKNWDRSHPGWPVVQGMPAGEMHYTCGHIEPTWITSADSFSTNECDSCIAKNVFAPAEDCKCGQEKYHFECVCRWVAKHPGDTEYSCENCGLYAASKPRCNRCESD